MTAATAFEVEFVVHMKRLDEVVVGLGDEFSGEYVGSFEILPNWYEGENLCKPGLRLSVYKDQGGKPFRLYAHKPTDPFYYGEDSPFANGVAAALAAPAHADAAEPEVSEPQYAVLDEMAWNNAHKWEQEYVGSLRTMLVPKGQHDYGRPWLTPGASFSVFRREEGYCPNRHGLWAAGNDFRHGGDFLDDRSAEIVARLLIGKPSALSEIKTQKARGINLLRNTNRGAPQARIILNDQQLEAAAKVIPPRGMFARPCPVRPRHGFVESRMVYKPDELRNLWTEARAADPEAELVLMPFIQGPASAILTRRLITVGPGNDGATSGKDCVNIPLSGVDLDWTQPALGEGDDPYVEIVYSENDEPTLVQVRGGPATDGNTTGNWIPQQTIVSQVLRADGDLLEWESTIHQAPPGTVVWSPGGSMLSHYAVHARLSGIPIVFDQEPPEIGATLEPTGDTKPSFDRDAFRLGALDGALIPIQNPASVVAAILLACHHGAGWSGPEMSRALGMAAVAFVRIGYAAGVGEFRHKYSPMINNSRDTVYDRMLKPGEIFNEESRALVAGALHSFRYTKWKRGYGGKAWATCVQATVDIEDAVRAVIGTPGRKGTGKIETVLKALNRAVNLAHNSGWWLNKFTTQNVFNDIAAGEHIATASAALYLYNMLNRTVPSFDFVGWPAGIVPTEIVDPDPTRTAHLNEEHGEPCSICQGCKECGSCPGEHKMHSYPAFKFAPSWVKTCKTHGCNCGCREQTCECFKEWWLGYRKAQVKPNKPDLIDESWNCSECDACQCPDCFGTQFECKCIVDSQVSVQSSTESSGEPPINTGDKPDSEEEEDNMKFVPSSNEESRIQAVFRPESGTLHIQRGVTKSYKKTDVQLSFPEAQEWLGSLESRKATTSLAASDTVYWIIDDLDSVPESVASAIQGLE